MSLESKKCIGSLRSFIKKSLTRNRFSLTDICSSNHLLIKSIEVFPTTIINSPNNMRNIIFMSCLCMPISTIDCVKKGKIISNIHPTNSPIAIIAKYFYIVEYIQSQLSMSCYLPYLVCYYLEKIQSELIKDMYPYQNFGGQNSNI